MLIECRVFVFSNYAAISGSVAVGIQYSTDVTDV